MGFLQPRGGIVPEPQHSPGDILGEGNVLSKGLAGETQVWRDRAEAEPAALG